MTREAWVLIGTGSQSRYVIDIAADLPRVHIVALVDVENRDNVGRIINGVPVTCVVEDLAQHHPPEQVRLIIGYGDTTKKKMLAEELSEQGYRFATAQSPAAYVSPHAKIAEGAILNPLCTVLANAHIGRHAIIHSMSVIEHDNHIGDFANIAPGVALGGYVTIGEGAYVYTGASVVPRRSIGAWSKVGAGAVVLSDVEPKTVVVGCPARAIKKV